jgi:hypothetical protein
MPVRATLFSYFELEDLVRLMEAIDASDMPARTRVHVGSYGVNFDASALIRSYPGCRFSPMFKAESRTIGWERRNLTRDEERRVSRRFSGHGADTEEVSERNRRERHLCLQ